MKRYRILFFFWLLFWLFIWVFGKTNIGLYILSASLICIAAELALAHRLRKYLSLGLSCSSTNRKRTAATLSVTLRNEGPFACAKARVSIRCHNLLTGEKNIYSVLLSVNGRDSNSSELELFTERCGKLNIEAVSIGIYDAFGLFCFNKTISNEIAMLVLPDIYPVELVIGPQLQMDMDSDEYSMLYSGDDPSETFALREYRSGDEIKKIHWKISQKLDETIVREAGLPVNNSLLILLDNSAVEYDLRSEVLEMSGEMAVSLSAALSEKQLPHDLGWFNREKNEMEICHIADVEDLTKNMSAILSAETVSDKQTVLEHFTEEHRISEFASILLITKNTGTNSEIIDDTFIVRLSPSPKDKEGVYVEI